MQEKTIPWRSMCEAVKGDWYRSQNSQTILALSGLSALEPLEGTVSLSAGEHQLRDMEGWVRNPCPVADSKEKSGSPISRNRIVFLHPPELRGNRKTKITRLPTSWLGKRTCHVSPWVPWWVHDYYFFSSQPAHTCSHLGKILTQRE